MHFDGLINKQGFDAGVWIIYPHREFMVYSFKLNFKCINKVAKYEASILGLNILKDLKANMIDAYGYYELVINQVNGSHQTKHPRMRAYKN